MLCHDWRSLGVSAKEVRQFCVLRDGHVQLVISSTSQSSFGALRPRTYLRTQWSAVCAPSPDSARWQSTQSASAAARCCEELRHRRGLRGPGKPPRQALHGCGRRALSPHGLANAPRGYRRQLLPRLAAVQPAPRRPLQHALHTGTCSSAR